jgi:adenylate cyclase
VNTPGEFFHELKRRKVVRVAVVYAATAFVLLQAADIMLPRLGVPESGMTLIVVLVVLGFPLALVLGWAFEVTPDGVRTTAPVASEGPIRDSSEAGAPALLGWGTVVVAGALVALGVGLALGGGRLLAPGPDGPPPTAGPQDAPGAPAPVDDRSIAVLAFANMSDDPAGEYFADGLSEEILNVLAQVGGLQVAGRTSSFAWKGRDEDLRVIGATLGVAHILEGSVRRQNNQVRVTAQLIRAADGFHLWSDTYDRRLDDVFVIQDDIAASVLRALRIVLDEDQRRRMEQAGVRNVEAFIAYQRGRELFGLAHGTLPLLPTLVRANQHFDEAIARVPDFSAAHFLKSDYYAHLLFEPSIGQAGKEAALDSIRTLLRTAAQSSRNPLHQDLIEVDRTLFSSDWRGLGERFENALERIEGCPEPNWIEVAAVLGYADAVIPLFRRRTECDPLDSSGWFLLGSASLVAGDAEGALRHAEAGRRAGGEQNPFLTALAQAANLAVGRIDDAKAEAARSSPDDPYFGPASQVLPLAAAGRLDEGREALAGAQARLGVDHPFLLFAYAAMGMRDEANALASAVDRWPAGWMLLTVMTQHCYCGLPFDLEAAPNLQSRIREAGVDWPPPARIRYPAKDW